MNLSEMLIRTHQPSFGDTSAKTPLQVCLPTMLKLQEVGVESFIIGGAPRDSYCGRKDQIKDYDLCVHSDMLPIVCAVLPGINIQFSDSWRADDDIADTGILYTDDGYEINFIFVTHTFTLQECCDRCDFGICQIGIAIDGHMYSTEAFNKDVAYETFTYTRSSEEYTERSQRRFERLTASKYKGWKLVLPNTEQGMSV